MSTPRPAPQSAGGIAVTAPATPRIEKRARHQRVGSAPATLALSLPPRPLSRPQGHSLWLYSTWKKG